MNKYIVEITKSEKSKIEISASTPQEAKEIGLNYALGNLDNSIIEISSKIDTSLNNYESCFEDADITVKMKKVE